MQLDPICRQSCFHVQQVAIIQICKKNSNGFIAVAQMMSTQVFVDLDAFAEFAKAGALKDLGIGLTDAQIVSALLTLL